MAIKKRTARQEARNEEERPIKMAEMYMPLVHSIASIVSSKGLPPSIDYNDLVADGTVGLMKAWKSFDPSRGVKFETYSSYRIRGEILDGLKNYNPVPYRVQVMIRDVAKKGYAALTGKKELEEEESYEKKEISEDEFKKAITKIRKIVSASALMYLMSLESAQESGVEINVSTEKTPVEELEFAELRERLKKSLNELPGIDQQVIDLFFNRDMNQKDIASKMKLSRSKVNRIIGKAIVFLRGKLK
ncbi:MAG: sigma-70 family RNA polymerase sigma factor [bacterium]